MYPSRHLIPATLLHLLLLSAEGPSVLAESQCRHMVRFNFAYARDGAPSGATPQPSPTVDACDTANVFVVCSDAEFPNDFLCDDGRIRLHHDWQNQTQTVGMAMLFKHPSAAETYCKTKMTSGAMGDSVIDFVGADCQPPVDDEVLPPFRVADASVLEVTAVNPPPPTASSTTPSQWDLLYQQDECFMRIYSFGSPRVIGGAVKGGSKGPRAVKFHLNGSYCQTPTTTIVGGRDTLKTRFGHDGRRYRPIAT